MTRTVRSLLSYQYYLKRKGEICMVHTGDRPPPGSANAVEERAES
jgi:hypothetical protein